MLLPSSLISEMPLPSIFIHLNIWTNLLLHVIWLILDIILAFSCAVCEIDINLTRILSIDFSGSSLGFGRVAFVGPYIGALVSAIVPHELLQETLSIKHKWIRIIFHSTKDMANVNIAWILILLIWANLLLRFHAWSSFHYDIWSSLFHHANSVKVHNITNLFVIQVWKLLLVRYVDWR